MSEYEPITSDSDLKARFEQRRGVTDPAGLVAAELQNITDAMLEMLKYLRQIRSEIHKK